MNRRLTLSFDNGPSPDTTNQVLDLLDRRGITAWFCVVGEMVAAQGGVELLRRIESGGHRLVNHSLTHAVPLGDDLSETYADREIGGMQELLEASLDSVAERWFRPFGRGGALGPHVFSPAAIDRLTADGYSVLMWNSVPGDWIDPVGWVDRALADIEANDHTVVVLHDLPTGAMDHLERFLDAVVERGVTIDPDPPESCVPISHGVIRADLAPLTA